MHSSERMTPAFGGLFEAIKRQEISHDGHAVYAQQILNAVPRLNERGFTLAKRKSRGKIDSAYALMMYFARASVKQKVRSPSPPVFLSSLVRLSYIAVIVHAARPAPLISRVDNAGFCADGGSPTSRVTQPTGVTRRRELWVVKGTVNGSQGAR
jgi:hypothetical protein